MPQNDINAALAISSELNEGAFSPVVFPRHFWKYVNFLHCSSSLNCSASCSLLLLLKIIGGSSGFRDDDVVRVWSGWVEVWVCLGWVGVWDEDDRETEDGLRAAKLIRVYIWIRF